jgi:hypothetical protein
MNHVWFSSGIPKTSSLQNSSTRPSGSDRQTWAKPDCSRPVTAWGDYRRAKTTQWTTAARKQRSLPKGAPNVSNRPLCCPALQDRLGEKREKAVFSRMRKVGPSARIPEAAMCARHFQMRSRWGRPTKGARRLVAAFLGEANTMCDSQPAAAAARSRLKSPALSRPIQC